MHGSFCARRLKKYYIVVIKWYKNMGLTSLIFRDTVKIRADYGEIVDLFKGRLNEKYLMGFIDKDETQLFYFSDVLSRSFSPSLPVIQLNFKNQADNNREIEIKFKLVNLLLIFFGLANGLVLFFSIFHVDSDKIVDIPLSASIFVLVFSYGLLLLFYRSALAEFKREIERLY